MSSLQQIDLSYRQIHLCISLEPRDHLLSLFQAMQLGQQLRFRLFLTTLWELSFEAHVRRKRLKPMVLRFLIKHSLRWDEGKPLPLIDLQTGRSLLVGLAQLFLKEFSQSSTRFLLGSFFPDSLRLVLPYLVWEGIPQLEVYDQSWLS